MTHNGFYNIYVVMIPAFDQMTGYLPPGEHHATWNEVAASFGWNAPRQRLLGGLRRAAISLREAGCTFFLLDGSFVTAKELPGDYDACCDYRGMNPLAIDPIFLSNGATMKAEFLGEIYPETRSSGSGIYSMREFFQTDRDDVPKGVVILDLNTVL
ncbi:DUF6932 family protein [Agrobacterium tumefaciens]|uniref:DUF6932 family protein n=1 Tax=Agrobacterium tumefaciens TaxID=358 RepID=UPI00157403E6|nr:hypothetical protein [Agrobacterium tumefaciens]NTA18888.1 hypothetical protein [Agrobacterium tumefaciens]WCK72413.1 hypothetical protein G6L96_014505 [Agrobacterium tumefaciens]